MTAATYDFTIEQGATLAKTLIWNDSTGSPVDLTGYTARMQVRQSVSSTTVLLELTSADGEIVITPSTGTIVLNFPAATTAAITWRHGKYDLELESSTGIVTRLIEGQIDVSPEVTR
jgi:hypothetical protein